jgi:hypothetical protein
MRALYYERKSKLLEAKAPACTGAIAPSASFGNGKTDFQTSDTIWRRRTPPNHSYLAPPRAFRTESSGTVVIHPVLITRGSSA